MKTVTHNTQLLARLLLAPLFLVSGLGKIFGFSSTVGYMQISPIFGVFDPFFLQLLLILGIIFELAGGVMILLNYNLKAACVLLITFTAVATAAFHTNIGDQMQFTAFLKNMAIIGGLFALMGLSKES